MSRKNLIKALGFCLWAFSFSAFSHGPIDEAREAIQNADKILRDEGLTDEMDLDSMTSKVDPDDLAWMQGKAEQLKNMGCALSKNKNLSEDPIQAALELSDPNKNDSSSHKSDLFVFASFSMPPRALQELASDAANHGAHVILRGFIDNKASITVVKVREVFAKHSANLLIDPERFTQFNITQVPAIVLAKPSNSYKQVAYDKIYGDIAIDYALQKFAERGDLANLAKLRKI